MSITDELREWAHEHLYKSGIKSDLLAIADRIDKEYEDELQDMHNVAYAKGFMDAMKERANWASWHEDEMAEYGWIRLPEDADGVPIRYGDILIFTDPDGEEWKLVAKTAVLMNYGWKVHTDTLDKQLLFGDCDLYGDKFSCCRHYHKHAVEDVLRELVGKAQALSNVDDKDELVSEFAKRLTLAGDAE